MLAACTKFLHVFNYHYIYPQFFQMIEIMTHKPREFESYYIRSKDIFKHCDALHSYSTSCNVTTNDTQYLWDKCKTVTILYEGKVK